MPRPWTLLLVALGAALFLAHASIHADWLIDDAGISLAYARNWAAGHGLVAQPGAAPVEGYSDPLWVVLLAALYWLGLMQLPGSVKLLSLALLGAAALGLWWGLRREAGEDAGLVVGAVLCFSGLNVSVVLWGTSGLEPPLYLAMLVGLWLATLRAATPEASPGSWAACGLVAAGVATTRPEGLAYGVLPPLLLLARAWKREGRAGLESRRRHLLAYAAGWLAPLALGFLARRLYYGAWWPNTYLVKGGPKPADLVAVLLAQPVALEKLMQVTPRAFGVALCHPILLAVLGGTVALGRRHRLGFDRLALGAFAAWGLLLYLLLPPDWMAETRFAAPIYPLLHAACFAVLAAALRALPEQRRPRLFALVTLTLLVSATPDSYQRAVHLGRTRNLGVDFTERAHGERFDRIARRLGKPEASLMVPDLGGTLLASSLRVVDLAGLCDRRVAETLDKDPDGLREYVLGEVRPDFLVPQGPWASMTRFEEDPRFERDYLALYRYTPEDDGWVPEGAAGVFMRRELVAGRPALLEELRAEDHRLESFLREPRRGPAWRWLLALPLPKPPVKTAGYRLGDSSSGSPSVGSRR